MKAYKTGMRTDVRVYGLNEKEEFEKDKKTFLNSSRHDVKEIFVLNGYGLEITKARTIY